jgi:D-cysteine desulfhydrase family pyridoxal phosphate-dependent enzyme
MDLDAFPRAALGVFPTPIIELRRLSAKLGGPRILIKRDDLSGLAEGGNKVRKLEFLIGDALAKGCDCVVTGGAAQSNHCRQAAAAAASQGLACHLALAGAEPPLPEGNLLLDRLLGAAIHWCGERRKGEDIPAIAARLASEGRKPYVMPYGGSSAIGALGFVAAARELAGQLADLRQWPSRIVFASSSGGTQAGLAAGAALYGLEAQLTAIAIDKAADDEVDFTERIRALANETAALLGSSIKFKTDDIKLRREFSGDGYGVVGEPERRAIRLAAGYDGLLLDPVYTGRAFGALVSMIDSGEIRPGEIVLFWHTGGIPALFPYARDLVS